MWNRLCDIVRSRLFQTIIGCLYILIVLGIAGVGVFMSPTESAFGGWLIAFALLLAEAAIRHFCAKFRAYYDIVSGGVLVLLGVIAGVMAIFTFLDFATASLLLVMWGGGDMVRGLWNQGWGWQAVVTAVVLILLTPIPFFARGNVTIPRKSVAGDYSAQAVCDECGKPADGGVDRIWWGNEAYYCRSCFEHWEEFVAGYPDCIADGCDAAKISDELRYCEKHASKCEYCGTPIEPNYVWCETCTKEKLDK